MEQPVGTVAGHGTRRGRRAWAPVAAGVVVLLLAAAVLLNVSTSNPPALYRDEAGIALDAALVAASGRDEHGALLPLYFESYGDWKSAPYTYLLAGLFAVTGPSELAARTLSAVLGLAAVGVLGLVGARLSGRRAVGVATAALAAATPWLFEVTRLVFEVALMPLAVALLLLQLARLRGSPTWSVRQRAGVGLTLGLVTYAYAGGRALAPLLALALLVFAAGGRHRAVLGALAWYAGSLLPLAVFLVLHPRALLERYLQVSGDEPRSPAGRLLDGGVALVRELDLAQWVLHGDRNARHHVQGSGSLLLVGVLLAAAGSVVLVRRRAWEPFWTYVALGIVISAVPAAIGDVRLHSLRSVALPVFLVVLAVPALASMAADLRRPLVAVLAAATVVLGVAQFTLFQVQYADHGPRRDEAFAVGLRAVLRTAVDSGRTVAVHRADIEARGGAQWYALVWDVPLLLVEEGRRPPAGSAVVAYERVCPSCPLLDARAGFVAYVAP